MQPSATDRRLLAGIFALQLEFITVSQFVAAINAWVGDKERSIQSFLIEMGALDSNEADMIHDLVDQHLSNVGSDVRSITLPETVHSVEDDLTQIGDADVDIFLHLLKERNGDEQPVIARDAPPSDEGRFQIVEKIAEGGLGLISRARDIQLNRDVALKEIQPQHADSFQSRLRFVLEAEVTGGLEHPGIVPVYALGVDPQGRPFYAMRMIRGESLRTVIRKLHERAGGIQWTGQNVSTLRRLIARLVYVSNTIAYAHSRGVLHRDIKPANIMLGKFGETLIVDWGLAKAIANSSDANATRLARKQHEIEVDQSSEDSATLNDELPILEPLGGESAVQTMDGDRLGTPSYMSPEQANGQRSNLGPTTDIYSLGATLYELLVGQPPHRNGGDSKPGEPYVPVLRVNRSVPKPLAAICDRAMQMRPEDRYRNASELASDLENWIADDRVDAWDEPAWDRARRWMRKNQTWFAGLIAAALVAAISLGVFAYQANQSSQRLRLAADRERAASEQARANEEIAKQQSELALDALNSIVFQVQERLKSVPAAQPARRELLKTALNGLDKLAGQFVDKGHVGRNQSRALVELSGIMLTVGEDDTLGTSVQHALDTANRAVAAAKAQFEENREDEQTRADLFGALDQLCLVHERLGNSAELAEVCGQLEQLVGELRDAASDSSESQAMLAAAESRVGRTQRRLGSTKDAVSRFGRAIEILSRLQDSSSDPLQNRNWKRRLAMAFDDQGMALDQLARRQMAVQSLREAISITDRLLEEDTQNVVDVRARSVYVNNLASVHLNDGKPATALPLLEEALEVRESLLSQDPANEQLVRDVSVVHDMLAKTRIKLKRPDDALDHYQQSLDLVKRLADADPQNEQARLAVAKETTNLATLYYQTGDMEKSLELHLAARAIDQKLVDKDPLNLGLHKDLAICCLNIGMTHARLGQLQLSAEAYEDSLKANLKAFALDHSNAYAREYTAWVYWTLAETYREMGNEQFCVRTFKDGIAFAEQILDLEPDNAAAIADRFQLQSELALYQGDITTAKTLAGEFAASDPDNADNWYNAACIYSLGIKRIRQESPTPDSGTVRELERLAVSALKKSVAVGYDDFDNMRKDEDLLPLSSLPEFRAIFPDSAK